jgi:hypothetical protein
VENGKKEDSHEASNRNHRGIERMLARLELEKQWPRYREPRPGFEIQPVVVLRECEAWTVVARNSRNARVFGARYWREG